MEKSFVVEYKSGIKYISYLDNTGYGIAGKMLINALSKTGVPITWHPLERNKQNYIPVDRPSINSGYSRLDEIYRKEMEYDLTIIHSIPLYYETILEEEKKKGKRVFGHTVWETDRLPLNWVHILNRLDGVIVPSHWNKAIFEFSGVSVPIIVLPHVSQFEGEIKTDESRFLSDIESGTFVFYTIAEWTERKLLLKQIETFMNTFSRNDNVCLIIKSSKLDYTSLRRTWRTFFRKRYQPLLPKVNRILGNYKSSARCIILTDPLTDLEIQQLHQRGNCFLSLCRSEGWGMGAYEAAWYGKPIIITGFGGQLDFSPPEYSYMVNYDLVNVSPSKGWDEYEPNQNWAEPDQVQASRLMKEVYNNQKNATERGLQLRNFMIQNFNRNRIVAIFNSIFQKC